MWSLDRIRVVTGFWTPKDIGQPPTALRVNSDRKVFKGRHEELALQIYSRSLLHFQPGNVALHSSSVTCDRQREDFIAVL